MQHKAHHSGCRITALISVGLHPDSGRARRAGQDARAVEMGLALASGDLELLHAGDPHNAALRSYAGMGVRTLRVLPMTEQGDAVAVLSHYLKQDHPDVILTGGRAERGESSGMLPFLLAEALEIPVVVGVAEIVSLNGTDAEVLQALPRGQRRLLRVALPFIASVDMAAAAPRQSAFGPANRAEITTAAGVDVPDTAMAAWEIAPARKRPKRLKKVKAKTAADRFKAATAKSQSEGGKVLQNKPVNEMAQAVFDLLLEEGVIR
ncbi:electron transfer flavoprotein subunit beta [Pantoea sp. M_9]|uniref:electron transfer flavoprotein subunit beta n=1 Tax=Pantoea sp. M_9 TaxID=2608041 RepID=UPI001231A55A|nr:electron transfer flavoprotein subunit beta [Pantoea sp. M_9]KAA5972851.1 electron transfer flavoprotein subunit beta [Pantoea sp. M_9]